MSPPPGLPDPSPEAVPGPSARVAKPRAFKARRVAAALSVATGLALGGLIAANDTSSSASGSTPKGTSTVDRPSSGEYGDDGAGRETTPLYAPDYGQSHTRSGGS